VTETVAGCATCSRRRRYEREDYEWHDMNWSEFFHMGGYAFYVWTSYAIALVLVILNIVAPVLQRRRIVSRIKRALRREALERDRERDRQSSGQ